MPSWLDEAEEVKESSWLQEAEPVEQKGYLDPEREQVPTPIAAARGGFQGITKGFGDELVAGTTAAVEGIGEQGMDTLKSMTGMQKEPPMSLSDRYKKTIDRYHEVLGKERGANVRARQQHPVATAGTDIAASILSPTKGVKTAIAQGATHGFGRGEGGVPERIADAALGGTIGAAGFGAGKLVEKGFKAVKPFLQRQAMKSLDLPKKVFKNLRTVKIKPEELDDIVIQNKLIGPDPEDTLKRIGDKMWGEGQLGSQIGETIDSASAMASTVPKLRVGRTINKVIKEAEEIEPGLGNKLRKQLKKLMSQDRRDFTIRELWEERKKIDELMKGAGKYKSAEAARSAGDVLFEGRTALNKLIKERMQEVLDPEAFNRYLKLNKDYTTLTLLRPAVEDAIDKAAQSSRTKTRLSWDMLLNKGKDIATMAVPKGRVMGKVSAPGAAIGRGMQKGQKAQLLLDQYKRSKE